MGKFTTASNVSGPNRKATFTVFSPWCFPRSNHALNPAMLVLESYSVATFGQELADRVSIFNLLILCLHVYTSDATCSAIAKDKDRHLKISAYNVVCIPCGKDSYGARQKLILGSGGVLHSDGIGRKT